MRGGAVFRRLRRAIIGGIVRRMSRNFGSPVLIALSLAMLFFGISLSVLQAQSVQSPKISKDVHDTPVPLPAPEQPLPL